MRLPTEVNVLVTGAGRGIGKRLAIGFARAKARVGLLGRSQAELDVTKFEIEDGGGTAMRLRADVRNYEQVSAAAERVKREWGGVHVLVANAGVQGPIGPFAHNRPSAWQEVFETNVQGTMNACRAVLPGMLERRAGKIIIVADRGAAEPRPGFSAYAASKAALVRLAECLAEEVRDDNVQVNCILPGDTYTNMTDEIVHAGERAGVDELETAEKVQSTGGTAAEKQIQLALFLASEKSNHLSGKLIAVTDAWSKLEHDSARPEALTLRRHK